MFNRFFALFRSLKLEFQDVASWIRIRKWSMEHDVQCVHFIHDEKFTCPFVDFLNEYFRDTGQLVVCQSADLAHPNFRLPQGNNVFLVHQYFGGCGLRNHFARCALSGPRKLIFHSLFCGNVCGFLYSFKRLLEKSYWMIWGGDLYNAPSDKVNQYVRAHFHGIITDTDGDDLVYEERYGKCSEVHRAGYTFPITQEMIQRVRPGKRDYVRIQINNSCDSSTMEILDTLSRFKGENVKVRVIHSYGDLKYREAIEHRGREIFGDDFEAVVKYMKPDEYTQLMSENDILILNQNRQQGLGNCFAALALGVKLFIRSEITTFRHLREKGCVVNDTNKIAEMDFETLLQRQAQEIEQNRKAAEPFFDGRNLYALWKPILGDGKFQP